MTETVRHLHCTQCDTRIGVARLDSVAHLVCHCTHVDGDLEPVMLESPAAMLRIREPWEFVANRCRAATGLKPETVGSIPTPPVGGDLRRDTMNSGNRQSGRHQIDCEECNHTSTGENERDAEVNHLLHYRRKHAESKEQRTKVNNELSSRGYDP